MVLRIEWSYVADYPPDEEEDAESDEMDIGVGVKRARPAEGIKVTERQGPSKHKRQLCVCQA